MGAALQNSFGEPFWGRGLKNRSFGAIVLDSSFGEQLSSNFGAAFGSRFAEWLWEPFWRTGLQNRSFRATALENSFGAQLWGAAPGNSFG